MAGKSPELYKRVITKYDHSRAAMCLKVLYGMVVKIYTSIWINYIGLVGFSTRGTTLN
jgi:hypothetical protein